MKNNGRMITSLKEFKKQIGFKNSVLESSLWDNFNVGDIVDTPYGKGVIEYLDKYDDKVKVDIYNIEKPMYFKISDVTPSLDDNNWEDEDEDEDENVVGYYDDGKPDYLPRPDYSHPFYCDRSQRGGELCEGQCWDCEEHEEEYQARKDYDDSL